MTTTTIPFKDLVTQNSDAIKSYMRWDNYDLNEIVIPVVEDLKNHALVTLINSYGLFHVEQNILDELCADVFIYFPVLLQQLAITRLIDAYGVVKEDTNTEEVTRTETQNNTTENTSEVTVGTSISEDNSVNNEQKTTGTVSVESESTNVQESTTNIENDSNVLATGNRNVNLIHNMPEQSISGSTGYFPSDPEGTPILTTSYVQSATESFNSSNPINTLETSDQTVTANNSSSNDSTTTNDVTVSDIGTTSRTLTNSGSDSSDSLSTSETSTTATETRTQTTTNKQYAYEIKTFLETADSVIAFQRWEDRFAWVVGII